MVAPDLIELLGEDAPIPADLLHLAEFAEKAKGENQKRRWRTNPRKNVVNLSDLIKKRELKALEKEQQQT